MSLDARDMTNLIQEEAALITRIDQEIEDMELKRAEQDVMSVLKVNKSLEGLLENEKAAKHFDNFMWEERCEENFSFIERIKHYRAISDDRSYSVDEIWSEVHSINEQFLIPGVSRCQLYIPTTLIHEFREQLQQLEKNTEKKPPIALFDMVEKEVIEIIRKTSYQKFIRTSNMKKLLSLTVQGIRKEEPIIEI